MSKQEKIREGIGTWLLERDACHDVDCGNTKCNANCPYLREITERFMAYLHSQGVVIKVERELDEEYFDGLEGIVADRIRQAGYVAVEPLIEEGDAIK